jgi:hypothetical protein
VADILTAVAVIAGIYHFVSQPRDTGERGFNVTAVLNVLFDSSV